MSAINCAPVAPPRTKTFWTTQPDACGTQEECGIDCGRAGLRLFPAHKDCPGAPCSCCGQLSPYQMLPCSQPDNTSPKTFATNDWIRSLALNMLLTDGRKSATVCGRRPGSLNGHWSESYIAGAGTSIGSTIQGNADIGTQLRYIDPSTRIQELTQLVKAEVMRTLQKLVAYGVAYSIEIEATYQGRMTIFVEAAILTRFGQTANVAVSGAVRNNQWAWN